MHLMRKLTKGETLMSLEMVSPITYFTSNTFFCVMMLFTFKLSHLNVFSHTIKQPIGNNF